MNLPETLSPSHIVLALISAGIGGFLGALLVNWIKGLIK